MNSNDELVEGLPRHIEATLFQLLSVSNWCDRAYAGEVEANPREFSRTIVGAFHNIRAALEPQHVAAWDETLKRIQDNFRSEHARNHPIEAKPNPPTEKLTAETRENIVDEIESIICETHELDVRDVDYAENIVSWLERHHPDALRAIADGADDQPTPEPSERDKEAHEHWRISVETFGDLIVAIEPECLAGRNPSATDEATIYLAIQHLLSFIGGPNLEALIPADAPATYTQADLDAVEKAEREACAALAWSDDEDRPWESWGQDKHVAVAQDVSQKIAAAIRARGGDV